MIKREIGLVIPDRFSMICHFWHQDPEHVWLWSGTIKGSGVELEHQLGSGDETTCHMCRSSDTTIFNLGTKPLVICAASAPDTTLFECVAPSPCLFLPNWSPALSRGGRYVVGKIDTDSYLHLHVYIYMRCKFVFSLYFLFQGISG